ncbi:MAG TPA: citrate:proton symporter, partial [Robiginitalea sp.]|nr:citrate:proton symporter [Robiginitalea sp.]
MLALLGLLTIVVLLVLIMSKKVSAVVALLAVPVVAALAGGFGSQVFTFMTDGIRAIAPTGVMFIFAILFFGILTDAGTFRPIIGRLLRLAGRDPARIALATAVLAMIVHLDGSGAVTFLITVPALLPLYDAIGMRRTTLATIVALGAGTMNILPWGGPTLRAASALDVPVTDLFNPLLVPVGAGLLFVLLLAYRMGAGERGREGSAESFQDYQPASQASELTGHERPRLFWLNIVLILVSVVALVSGFAPPHVVFMLAFAVAVTVNYPNLKQQTERVNSHARAALLMAGILF